MRWRIRKHTCPDGTETFYPEHRGLVFWYRLEMIDWLGKVWNRYDESHELKHDFNLRDSWEGHVYFYSEEDARKTIEYYEQTEQSIKQSKHKVKPPKDTFIYL